MRKEDFTEVEWQAIREAPHWAGLAVMVAGSSGVLGSLKEAFAAGHATASGKQHPSELIRSLSIRQESEAVDRGIRAQIAQRSGTGAGIQEWVAETALTRLRSAGRVMSSKPKESADAYRQWVLDIAKRVTEAAKEGSVLGFGGTRVSAAEEAMIRKIGAALEGIE
ncbi:MAG: hypothetical protein JNL98_23200 [Bryobacterales bacterium]|nr:hypothetical protein [Bryobacterales bacterium]